MQKLHHLLNMFHVSLQLSTSQILHIFCSSHSWSETKLEKHKLKIIRISLQKKLIIICSEAQKRSVLENIHFCLWPTCLRSLHEL